MNAPYVKQYTIDKFCGPMFSELLRIARYTLKINYFILRDLEMFSTMIAQDENSPTLETKKATKQQKRLFIVN